MGFPSTCSPRGELIALANQGERRLPVTVPDDMELRPEPVPSLGPRGGPRNPRGVRKVPALREDEDLDAVACRPNLRERPPLVLAPERNPVPVHAHQYLVAASRRDFLQAREPFVNHLAGLPTGAFPRRHSNAASRCRVSGFLMINRYLNPRR